MDTTVKLFIRLTPGTLRPQWGRQYANEFDGGPATLLRWLETQLGLPVAGFHQADRITEYAAAIDALGESVIADSLAADRWATASELLTRRDELMLGGWDESDSESLPHIVRELARAASGKGGSRLSRFSPMSICPRSCDTSSATLSEPNRFLFVNRKTGIGLLLGLRG